MRYRETARRRDPEALDDAGLELEDRAEAHGASACVREKRKDARQEDVENTALRMMMMMIFVSLIIVVLI